MLEMVMSFNILGKLENLLHFYGTSDVQQQDVSASSPSSLKDLILAGSLRYDFNAQLAQYTGPFDYMELQCDRHHVIYSIHGKDLSLDGVRFAVPLSLIKPIYQTFIFPADVIVDPLQMEIDDELIVFFYHILHLYEKGKLVAAESVDGNTLRITSFG